MSYTLENNYFCSICRNLQDKQSKFCKKCKGVFSIVKLPKSISSSFIQKKKKNVASEILENRAKAYEIEGFEFLGEMPKKFNMMVFGMPGSGKSYFSLMFADTIAKMSKRKKTIYFTSEEELQNRDFQKKLIDCEISDNLILESIKDKDIFYKTMQHEYGNKVNIFLDSVTSLQLSPKQVDAISKKINGIFVFIIHVNKKGQYRGSTAYEHNTQVVINVKNGQAKTGKNRLGKSNQTYEIFERINDAQ